MFCGPWYHLTYWSIPPGLILSSGNLPCHSHTEISTFPRCISKNSTSTRGLSKNGAPPTLTQSPCLGPHFCANLEHSVHYISHAQCLVDFLPQCLIKYIWTNQQSCKMVVVQHHYTSISYSNSKTISPIRMVGLILPSMSRSCSLNSVSVCFYLNSCMSIGSVSCSTYVISSFPTKMGFPQAKDHFSKPMVTNVNPA